VSNASAQLPIFWYGKTPVPVTGLKPDSQHIKVNLHHFELLNQQLEKSFKNWVAA